MPSLDETALLAAIAANPNEDMPRLMYADWLDYEGNERVKCKSCASTGKHHHKTVLGDETVILQKTSMDCSACQGAGTTDIIDTSRSDRAELIRVQCELSRNWEMKGSTFGTIGGGKKLAQLRSRESTILAAHPEWFPKCPMCKGHGFIAYHSEGECPRCGKPGRVDTGRVGMFSRGFLDSVKVLTIADVLERRCKSCGCDQSEAGQRGNGCPRCDGGIARDLLITAYATDLIEKFPTLQCIYPMDYEHNALPIQCDGGWAWYRLSRSPFASCGIHDWIFGNLPIDDGSKRIQDEADQVIGRSYRNNVEAFRAYGVAVCRFLFSLNKKPITS